MYFDFIKWLEKHQASCFWKKYYGIDCLGCGMQRAFIELLKGNIIDCIILYPALIPLIFTFFFLSLHLIFKFKKGALILKISFIFTIIIMAINYLLKFI